MNWTPLKFFIYIYILQTNSFHYTVRTIFVFSLLMAIANFHRSLPEYSITTSLIRLLEFQHKLIVSCGFKKSLLILIQFVSNWALNPVQSHIKTGAFLHCNFNNLKKKKKKEKMAHEFYSHRERELYTFFLHKPYLNIFDDGQ